jgi:signal transduction histidine kinase
MPRLRDPDEVRVTGAGATGAEPATSVPFKRHLVGPGMVLGAAEVVLVAMPLWSLFDLGALGSRLLLRLALPVAVAATLLWVAATTSWLLPIRTAVVMRRRGEPVPKELAALAYRATLRIPLRALTLRTTLWAVTAGAIGALLVRHGAWTLPRAIEATALAAMHAFLVAAVRAVWLARVLDTLRARLFVVSSPLRRFGDAYYRRLVMAHAAVTAGALSATAVFVYYFVPIGQPDYLRLFTFLPPATLATTVLWGVLARWGTRGLRGYLVAVQGGGGDHGSGSNATSTYRRAQALPYRLALVSLGLAGVVALSAAILARQHLRLEFDDTVVVLAVTLIVALGAAIYESLWHRDTMAPLLAHLTVRYRVPVRAMAPALSLRTKLSLSFGGVVMLACGLALLWGFVQYKRLATESGRRQAELAVDWLRSEIQAEAAGLATPPTPTTARAAMQAAAARWREPSAVFYLLDDDGPVSPGRAQVAAGASFALTAVGGGPLGAPPVPWYVQLQLRSPGIVELGPAELAGRAERLVVAWHGTGYDLGAVAVLYPDYRGRSASLVRPLKELLVFFVGLFGACAGIVAVTVAQFVSPIRQLEQRADSMARGELADPVSSGGEGDEIGRLTFALEEMRRALRDRLRTTEEVNLDLERAVQTRTSDLARKNRELADALDKLTRTQDQLVRSEKMASIGQLVAGIAHEINNPVNAIVNTVGPLEETIGELESSDPATRQAAAGDVREMVRVVQRGAQRTKAIVQALHNYSRTDDETLVDFDVDRSLDDSLELLRHLIKGNVEVARRYGDVGRIRGHAGQVGQVFMNLLTNALQALAGRDGARITIETRRQDDGVVVEIGDNGPGIPAEVLPRIFDPFFTTKEVGEGTGLGLSIVHGLVERHGGSIDVRTEVGSGTTFVVTLPRQAVEPAGKRGPGRAEAARPGR